MVKARALRFAALDLCTASFLLFFFDTGQVTWPALALVSQSIKWDGSLTGIMSRKVTCVHLSVRWHCSGTNFVGALALLWIKALVKVKSIGIGNFWAMGRRGVNFKANVSGLSRFCSWLLFLLFWAILRPLFIPWKLPELNIQFISLSWAPDLAHISNLLDVSSWIFHGPYKLFFSCPQALHRERGNIPLYFKGSWMIYQILAPGPHTLSFL